MALTNIKKHVQAVRQNKGVLKTDQIELVGTATVPTTSGDLTLSDGRIYYNSSSDILYARIGGVWLNLASAGTSGISGWDSIYDMDKTLTIDEGTLTFNLTAANDGLTLAAAVTATTGAILQFNNSGSCEDIQGTGDTWKVGKTGIAAFNGALTCGDITRYGAAGNQNFTIDAKGSGTLVVQGTATGAITLTTATTLTHSAVITGAGGAAKFTITAGDMLMSDGSLTITDADNASTLAITNNSCTSASLVDINCSAVLTGNVIDIDASGITSGKILNLQATSDTMSSGYYIYCYDQDDAAEDFSVSDDGATTITGTVNSTVGLKVIGVQTSEDTVEITSSGVTASAKASLLLNPSGNIADNGTVIRIAPSGTPVAGSKAISIVGTGKNMQAIEADVDVTDEHGIALTGSGILNAASMLYVANDSTANAATDKLVQFVMSADTTAAGIILNLYGTGHPVSALTSDTDNTTTDSVAITGSGVLTGGRMLYVDNDGSGASSTDSVVQFKATPTDPSTYRVLHLNSQNATKVTALKVTASNTTVHAVDLVGSANLASGGVVLRVDNTGTPAAATDSVCLFTFTGTATNKPRIIDVVGTGKDVGGIYLDTDNTTTHAMAITGTGVLNAGNKLYVDTDATPNAATDSVVYVKMNTDGIGQGILLNLYGTTKTVSAIVADTDNTTTDAVKITGSGILAGGHMLYVDTDASGATVADSIVQFKASPTDASTASFKILDLYSLSNTAVTALKVLAGNTTVHAVNIDGSGALTGGNMLVVDNAGTPAANTDAVVHFTFTGTATNNPIVLEVDNGTKDAQCIRVDSNVTAATRPVMTIIQNHATGAQECLELDQDDDDVGTLKITATRGAGKTIDTTTRSTGNEDYILIDVNGSTRYIPMYDAG